jgi:hypothetical protein
MTCKLTMTLISESQQGNIGEDWKYDLDVKVLAGDRKGGGSVSVPKHNLPSGPVRQPHGAPAPQVVFTGECTDALEVQMHLVATEVDMFVNDVGKVNKELRIECPGPAMGTVTKEVDIAVGVRESPPIFPKKAVFTLRVRFTLTCE